MNIKPEELAVLAVAALVVASIIGGIWWVVRSAVRSARRNPRDE